MQGLVVNPPKDMVVAPSQGLIFTTPQELAVGHSKGVVETTPKKLSDPVVALLADSQNLGEKGG